MLCAILCEEKRHPSWMARFRFARGLAWTGAYVWEKAALTGAANEVKATCRRSIS
jgi:hypothetical protein